MDFRQGLTEDGDEHEEDGGYGVGHYESEW
jgi:hypothetical protein